MNQPIVSMAQQNADMAPNQIANVGQRQPNQNQGEPQRPIASVLPTLRLPKDLAPPPSPASTSSASTENPNFRSTWI